MAGIRSRRRRGAVAALVCCLASAWGCTSMWDSVRESQRRSSVRLSRELVERGQCVRAVETIERAQSSAALGRFEAESVWLRARCLSRLGLSQQALAHWRLLAESYPESPYVRRIPAETRAQLGVRTEIRAPSSPEAFEAPRPRYERGAQQAKLVGSVWLEFEIDQEGRVAGIRVIETPHPLLASFAVESLSQGKWVDRDQPVRPGRYGAKYRFEHLWAQPAKDATAKSRASSTTPGSSTSTSTSTSSNGSEAGSEGTDESSEESDEQGWEIEWFPTDP